MFCVQRFQVKGGHGLGWEEDRTPSATNIEQKCATNQTVFEILVGGTGFVCSLKHRHFKLRPSRGIFEGVIGQVENAKQPGAWTVYVANTSLEWTPELTLLDETNQIVVEIRWSESYNSALGRGVVASARSARGTQFWTTGPNLFETIAAFAHPRRVMYGLTNQQTFFLDYELVIALMLYESIFMPLDTHWSGCS